jgi:hypothetical protein
MPESTVRDETKETQEAALTESERGEAPIAYIPACGTLCDAFWWARRSDPKKPSD